MRVVHVACISPPEIGGIGRIAAETTADLQRRGIDARLISLTTRGGVRIGNAGRIRHLQDTVAGADIVHLHYPFFGTAGRLADLRRRGKIKRLVITLHMDATASGVKGFAFDLHRAWFQEDILDAADLLIAASKEYVRSSSFQIHASRIREIPFGVDTDFFCPGPSPLRTELGWPQEAYVIGFVGGMDQAHRFKGVDILLRACADLPAASVLLVGDGTLRSAYEVAARGLGLGKRCAFLGKVTADRLVQAYRAMTVLAFPSTSGAEAFGLVALEAQACGIPVVASALPGVRTVVADHETGLLVEPTSVTGLHQALEVLGREPLRWKVMGERARERILERFTWTAYMDALQDAYRSLV